MITRYLQIAGIVFVALIAMLALWYRGQAIAAHATLETTQQKLEVAEAANAAQQRAIETLSQVRAQNERIITQLFNEVSLIHQKVTETATGINSLKETNEQVRDYLNATIPDDLRRLLNERDRDRNDGGEGGVAPGTSSPTVPTGERSGSDNRRSSEPADGD